MAQTANSLLRPLYGTIFNLSFYVLTDSKQVLLVQWQYICPTRKRRRYAIFIYNVMFSVNHRNGKHSYVVDCKQSNSIPARNIFLIFSSRSFFREILQSCTRNIYEEKNQSTHDDIFQSSKGCGCGYGYMGQRRSIFSLHPYPPTYSRYGCLFNVGTFFSKLRKIVDYRKTTK